MEKLKLIYRIGVFVLLGLIAGTASANQNIVNLSGQYWFTNLPIFTDLSFLEQQELIDIFNEHEIHTPDGYEFRFATQSEMDWLSNHPSEVRNFMETDHFWFIYSVYWFNGYFEDGGDPDTVGFASFIFSDRTGEWTFMGFDTRDGSAQEHIGAWVVAQPIPEIPLPTSAWLFVSGLAIVGMIGRKKKPTNFQSA